MFLNSYNLLFINMNIINIFFIEFFISFLNNLSFAIDFSDTFFLLLMILIIIKQVLFFKDYLFNMFIVTNLKLNLKISYRNFYKQLFFINIFAFKTKMC